MTHPNREELAGRLEEAAALAGEIGREASASLFAEAAAALRQSPSVEEVARVMERGLYVTFGNYGLSAEIEGINEAAQAIAALYKRGRGS